MRRGLRVILGDEMDTPNRYLPDTVLKCMGLDLLHAIDCIHVRFYFFFIFKKIYS